MANEQKTRKDLEIALIMKAWKDDGFRQELLSNPKAAGDSWGPSLGVNGHVSV